MAAKLGKIDPDRLWNDFAARLLDGIEHLTDPPESH